MKVRNKVLIEMVAVVLGTIVAIKLLDLIVPGYGWAIYMTGCALYLFWCLYNLRVGMLEREQERIVDTLKQ